MLKSDFFYSLPEELIAQNPCERRDASRLLALSRNTGEIRHFSFGDLPELLSPGDLLVMNDSKVLPARLLGHKLPHGAVIEFLLLRRKDETHWEIMVRPGRKARPGSRFEFGGGQLTGEITAEAEGGNRIAKFTYSGDFYALLDQIGRTPLPPYITKSTAESGRYQTVYACEPGSAAAPTAGLHFTGELLESLRQKGIDTAFVTLHVGQGTFRPVKADDIAEHKMHSEWYSLPAKTVEAIHRAKAAKGRVIAVGTTSCRTLEAAAGLCGGLGKLFAHSGTTDIFISPGYSFKAIDGLITNFHLPESTLLMLVSAFAGRDAVMNAYQTAILERYRFYSFGDAMVIL
jgi:S-adenosylmethionine:tRNA ribosyltransferase-isomerase